jgi:hypothetical protein
MTTENITKNVEISNMGCTKCTKRADIHKKHTLEEKEGRKLCHKTTTLGL